MKPEKRRAIPMSCCIPDCLAPAVSLGMCRAHYRRHLRHGDANAGRAPHGARLRWLQEHAGYAEDACLRWPFSGNDRRPLIRFRGESVNAARVMCVLAHGEAPTREHDAAHSCGQGHTGCLNPKHLRWATKVENQADRVKHDTHARGERNSQAKLTQEQVSEMRSLADKLSRKELGCRYGIHPNHVGLILTGRRWSWLDNQRGSHG